MSGAGAIAIFVKTPGHSAVKTRLAATIGDAGAVAWHRRAAATVAAVATTAAAAAGAAVYWAVAEPSAIADGAWPDLPNLAQGEGGLGARMGSVHAALVARHGHGVLLGADAPQLEVRVLADALAWCAAPAPHQAIGPARDGGFWLYAGNRAPPPARWDGVGYSRPETARDFRAAFDDGGDWLVLPTLTDVDEAADLTLVARELTALAAPHPAQTALGAWLDATFGRDGAMREQRGARV